MEKGTGEVYGENFVPFLERKIQNSRVLDSRGVVYQDVELSKAFDRQCHHPRCGILARDVADKRQYVFIATC
jgi:hypothetical protein